MKKTNVITPMWQNCQTVLKSGDLELADDKINGVGLETS